METNSVKSFRLHGNCFLPKLGATVICAAAVAAVAGLGLTYAVPHLRLVTAVVTVVTFVTSGCLFGRLFDPPAKAPDESVTSEKSAWVEAPHIQEDD